MKRNPYYALNKIADKTYIMPFGQAVSDFQKAIQVNQTGEFLWNALAKDISGKELLQELADYYEADESELPIVKQDLIAFLENLSRHGMLMPEQIRPSKEDVPCKTLNIAGVTVKLYGPEELFAPGFDAFISDVPTDNELDIVCLPGQPSTHANGTLLLRTRDLLVMEQEESYLLLFPSSTVLNEAELSKVGDCFTIFYKPGENLKDEVFHAIRFAFLYLAQKLGMYAIHSASICYDNQAWLFSAPTQTGKSTHARLWGETIGSPVINGDMNLITYENHTPMVYGTPWCGSSGIADTKSYPLGGVIMLCQAPEDTIETYDSTEQRLALFKRTLTPLLTNSMQQQWLGFVDGIADHILICRLHCTPTSNAVKICKQQIDEYIATKQ